MSWYTNIYPDKQVFNDVGFKNIEDIKPAIEQLNDSIENVWAKILIMVFKNPSGTTDEIYNEFKQYWDQYMILSRKRLQYWHLRDMWQDEIDTKKYWEQYPNGGGYYKYDEDGNELTPEQQKKKVEEERANYKPSLWRNKFEYSDNPESGIEECKEFILKCRNKILAYVASSPNSITPEVSKYDSDQPVDIEFNINRELEDVREWLDENIRNLDFCELLVEYWDTKTEG